MGKPLQGRDRVTTAAAWAHALGVRETLFKPGLLLVLLSVAVATAQEPPGSVPQQAQPALAGDSLAGTAAPALSLYRHLRDLHLDPGRVYAVRDVALDRADIHITLNNGTIAFSQPVQGRITGAFFDGDGEILLVPPNQVERASLAFFTGSAILSERFSAAFFRFSDDTFERLQSALRPAEDAADFISHWDSSFRDLGITDAFELLRFLTWQAPGASTERRQTAAGPESAQAPGIFWHARLAGHHLGPFDVLFDSQHSEQISVAQSNYVNGAQMLDIWTSFAASSAGAAGPEGDITELGRGDFRIANYNIRTHILPSRALESEAQLTLVPARSGARTLVFELARDLKVSSLTADNAPVEFIQNESLQGSELARHGNDLVAVILPRPLRAGEKRVLRFTYAGSVLTDAGSGLLYVGARGIWYPNIGPAMSDFDLEFRYPAGWTLLATGKRVSAASAGGEQTSRWISERPIPLAGFNLGKYVGASAKAGDTLVETFAARGVEAAFKEPEPPPMDLSVRRRRLNTLEPPPPPSPTPSGQAQAVAQRSARAVDFLSRRLGPFPYSSLAITQLPGYLSQGWPGLVFLSSYAFLNAEERRRLQLGKYEDVLYSGLVQAHETAHQWWGDAVLWKGYRDGWLAEALANYSALMVLEQEKPEVVRTVLERYRQDLARKWHEGPPMKDAGPVTLGHRLTSSRLPEAYEVVCYGRGTWLIHMLREMFRDAERDRPDPDARFFQALRKIRERFDGRAFSTQDLQQALEEAQPPSLRFEGRKSLSWFFDGWVNGTALPRYQLSGVKFSNRNGKTTVSGTLLQKNAPDSLVTSVPLYATASRGQPVYLGRVFADGSETEFHLPAPTGARSLLVDPYQTVLTHP